MMLFVFFLCLIFVASADPVGYSCFDGDTQPSHFTVLRVGDCGEGHSAACNLSEISSVCDRHPCCRGFNSNGYLKTCVSSNCGASGIAVKGVSTCRREAAPHTPTYPFVPDAHFNPSDFDGLFYPSLVNVTAVAEQPTASAANSVLTAMLYCGHDSPPISVRQGSSFSCLGSDWLVRSLMQSDAPLGSGVFELASSARVSGLLYLTGGAAKPAVFLRSRVPSDPSKVKLHVYRLNSVDPARPSCLDSDSSDYLARVFETSFTTNTNASTVNAIAAIYPPVPDQGLLGIRSSFYSYELQWNGVLVRADGWLMQPPSYKQIPLHSGTKIVFNPYAVASSLSLPLPPVNFSDFKSSIVGSGRTMVTVLFDVNSRIGLEVMAVAPQGSDPKLDSVYVRFRHVSPDGAAWRETVMYYHCAYGTEPSPIAEGLFYATVLLDYEEWGEFFAGTSRVSLPPTDERLTVAAHSAMVATLTVFCGLIPNYGTGIDYFSPQDDALLLTSIHLWDVMVTIGAGDRVLVYFTWFVQNVINPQTGAFNYGVFGCDADSDYGRLLDFFVRYAVAMHHSPAWQAVEPKLLALLDKTVTLLSGKVAAGSEMFVGSGEHDVCHDPHAFFSINAWAARGLLRFGLWAESQNISATVKPEVLIAQALRLSATVAAKAAEFMLQGDFLPPFVDDPPTPFAYVTEGTFASYSNFRFWPELLLSSVLNATVASSVAKFAASHGSTIGYLLRWSDHLDDMPSLGWFTNLVELGHRERAHQMLSSHVQNYMSRGTFHATEQLGQHGDGKTRSYLSYPNGERDVDFCNPAALLSTAALYASFVHAPWRRSASDLSATFPLPDVIIGGGVPSNWYASPSNRVGAENVNTHLGNFTVSIATVSTSQRVLMVSFYASASHHPPYVAAVHLVPPQGYQLAEVNTSSRILSTDYALGIVYVVMPADKDFASKMLFTWK